MRNKNIIVAKLIGTDKQTDIFVLEIHSEHVDIIAELDSSMNIKTGDRVFTISSPLGLIGTVTSGIISSTKRAITMDLNDDNISDFEKELIQTDTATNSGSSGEGLFDVNGKLIGVLSNKVFKGGIEGLSFATPIDNIKNPSKI
ncbi:trypsin-like peptidase domain protein (plasmid) [Bacillus cereus]|uniref:S1C family serine protease n=1 Tax=Bacillus cereus TaxID=1396 RepID=UPI00003CB5AB|nr:trypsin-like peptidase domain-containing protein [Bacillus cereus]AIY72882.1 trypsin-like peptidase domain protein [Bacillus cereus]AJI08066.1 trypsin-like peptidase domain protein [Bacillus cereus G9241]EAL15942.1 protease HhoA [Bacillus cereus G9241]QPS53434.1 trypsin-like peptidase domain-containing protein [Bacillus tropicus]